ncbi:DUF3995 domain-containing protein [Aestuariibius sp. HNIBRBA575]|uniref:DUF3995 domain-containing protein n=1 Tax=Aestuariibius sp. HNIBRBA575 TaxID=3233343 RepID=UPI0034A1F197
MIWILSGVLLILAGLHIMWGLGIWWPNRDEAALARTIAGFKGIDRMPGAIPCAIVAVALLAAARWPHLEDGFLRNLGMFGFAAVFLGRGSIGFTQKWADITPEQPFRRLDRHYFSPLCLLIGAGYSLLLLQALT